jgi:putative MATE family efflux protein
MNQKENPLAVLPVKKLLRKFAGPSIVAMLVSALYNIVDQFFIGNSVGPLGNAATNIAFPLTTSCISIALLFGIGGASAFNLAMGRGEKDEAVYFMGNAASSMFICGTILAIFTQIFLVRLVYFFGAPENVAGYAQVYIRITSIGFPFLILATGGGHLIRADGSPKFTMLCNLTGAIINTILDAIFVFGMNQGMAGAALATIIGQFISACMAINYLRNCKSVTLEKKHIRPRSQYVGRVASLGAAPCSNQLAMMVTQIIMNKSLTYYGGLSSYGEEIPLACAGIITKVNQVFFSFIIGISQGLQPIISFNYGAGKYHRVKEAYMNAAKYGFILSIFAFALFQLIPRQIISLFGNGTEEYFAFAESYFRIFLFFTFLNFIQPITSNCFTAIGKPMKGMFLSLTRQILFLLPLLIILPMLIGIDGILYAGPIADLTAGIVAITMIWMELRQEKYTKANN